MSDASIIKEHILSTTVTLLQQGFELEVLTIRKIANKANIATGLINYHFGSKDQLLVKAIEMLIDRASSLENLKMMDQSLSPRLRLRQFLMAISKTVVHYKAYSKILLKYELLSDSFDTPQFIVPILREINPSMTEQELKWLSIQVVAPMQYIFMKEAGFLNYYDADTIDVETILEAHLHRLSL